MSGLAEWMTRRLAVIHHHRTPQAPAGVSEANVMGVPLHVLGLSRPRSFVPCQNQAQSFTWVFPRYGLLSANGAPPPDTHSHPILF